jgi:hypothetical protein
MITLPENQRLMPENEPEKNLKVQLRRNNSVLSPLQKPSAIHTVPFCSALFRQKFYLLSTERTAG